MPPVGWEKMNPAQLALSNASLELSLLHGLVIKHMPYRAEANLKVIELVSTYWRRVRELLRIARKYFGNVE